MYYEAVAPHVTRGRETTLQLVATLVARGATILDVFGAAQVTFTSDDPTIIDVVNHSEAPKVRKLKAWEIEKLNAKVGGR